MECSLDVLQFAHVNPSSFWSGTDVEWTVCEEPFEDHIVVNLVYDFGEAVVFSEEAQEFRRRPVDGQEPGMGDFLIGEHGFEQDAPTAEPLSRLVHVKVQHAHRVDLFLSLVGVQQKQVLLAHLQQADHGSPTLVTAPVQQEVDYVLVLNPQLGPGGDGLPQVLRARRRLAHGVQDARHSVLDLLHGLDVTGEAEGEQVAAHLDDCVTAGPLDRPNAGQGVVHLEVEVHGWAGFAPQVPAAAVGISLRFVSSFRHRIVSKARRLNHCT